VRYYRLIMKSENGVALFSEVIEQEMTESEIESLSWDKPIIRHEVAGHVHFIALDPNYLDAMLLGRGTYQRLSS
jgi:hypothetical protein